MTQHRTGNAQSPDPSGLRQIDALCVRFEDAWKRGESPELAVFLNAVAEAERSLLFEKLLELDITYRARTGQQPTPEQYVALHPDQHEKIVSLFDSLELATMPDGTPTEAAFNFLQPPQQPGEIGRLGAYCVMRFLGGGGMGIVFEAEDLKLNRRVALKVMRPEMSSKPDAGNRFLREARAMAVLEHENIAPIYYVGEDGAVPYFVMPLLHGETLDSRLQRLGPLPLDELFRIARELTEGLRAAHEKGLIHRDIKPANIWLDARTQRVLLLDFGLAREMNGDGEGTLPGALLGTPAYMAPEQARGEPVDCRCDLFSLGCVLYRACSGEPAFTGPSIHAVLHAVATWQPPPLDQLRPELPASLSQLITRLLEKSPPKRPASALEVLAALDILQAPRDDRSGADTEPVAAERGPSPVRGDALKPVRRGSRRLVLIVGLLALVVATILGLWLAGRDNKTTPVGVAGGPHHTGPLTDSPSPLDDLDPEKIPKTERFEGMPKELVAVLGRHNPRSQDWHATLAFLPDNQRLLTGGDDGNPLLWDVQSGRLLKRFERAAPNYSAVLRVDISRDGRRVLVMGYGPPAELWELEKFRKVRSFGDRQGTLGSGAVTFLPSDSDRFLVADRPQTHPGVIRLWKWNEKEPIAEFKGHRGPVWSLAVAPDGQHFVSGGQESRLLFWDLNHPEKAPRARAHASSINRVAFSPDGRHVLSGQTNGEVVLWEVIKDDLNEVAVFKDHSDTNQRQNASVLALIFSPDGLSLASAGYDSRVFVYETASRRKVREWDLHDWKLPKPTKTKDITSAKARGLAFAPDGRHLALATDLDVVYILRLAPPRK